MNRVQNSEFDTAYMEGTPISQIHAQKFQNIYPQHAEYQQNSDDQQIDIQHELMTSNNSDEHIIDLPKQSKRNIRELIHEINTDLTQQPAAPVSLNQTNGELIQKHHENLSNANNIQVQHEHKIFNKKLILFEFFLLLVVYVLLSMDSVKNTVVSTLNLTLKCEQIPIKTYLVYGIVVVVVYLIIKYLFLYFIKI